MTDFLPKPRARGPLTPNTARSEAKRLHDGAATWNVERDEADGFRIVAHLAPEVYVEERDEVETMRRATTPTLWRAVRRALVPVVIVVLVAVVLCVVVGAVS